MFRMLPLWFVVAGWCAAADHSVDAVKGAERSWAAAPVAGDEAALKQLLADDLIYTHSTGDSDNKAEFISNLKSGVRKYVKLDHEGMDAKLYGNTAVLRATAQIATSQNGGAPSPAHLRFIHLWVYQGGRWQLVAHQSLRLPK
jgi:ketosteroid isomerase-like protein